MINSRDRLVDLMNRTFSSLDIFPIPSVTSIYIRLIFPQLNWYILSIPESHSGNKKIPF